MRDVEDPSEGRTESTARGTPNGLPRALRIRKSRDFRRLERQALKGSSPLVTALARPTGKGRGRVGFTVSKKVGDAVTRNRVKRLLREIVRQEKSLFEGLELILIARPDAATAAIGPLREAVRNAVAGAQSALAAERGRREKRREGPPRSPSPAPAPAPTAPKAPAADPRESRRARVHAALAARAPSVAYAYPDRENRLEDLVFLFEKREAEARFYDAILDDHVGRGARDVLGLDVGCGLGAYVPTLTRRVRSAFFVDKDAVRVAAAKRAHPDAALFAVDLLDDAPLDPALVHAFGLVQCIQVLGHVECAAVPRALARLGSLVDDGGFLLFAVPFTGAPFDDFWVTFLDGDAPRPMPTDARKFDRLARHTDPLRLPVRHFALETLRALLDENGLTMIAHQPYNWFSDVRGDLFVLAQPKPR